MKKLLIVLSIISSLLLSSCGANYAARAGDWEITAGEINFYLSSIKSQRAAPELASDEDWQDAGD